MLPRPRRCRLAVSCTRPRSRRVRRPQLGRFVAPDLDGAWCPGRRVRLGHGRRPDGVPGCRLRPAARHRFRLGDRPALGGHRIRRPNDPTFPALHLPRGPIHQRRFGSGRRLETRARDGRRTRYTGCRRHGTGRGLVPPRVGPGRSSLDLPRWGGVACDHRLRAAHSGLVRRDDRRVRRRSRHRHGGPTTLASRPQYRGRAGRLRFARGRARGRPGGRGCGKAATILRVRSSVRVRRWGDLRRHRGRSARPSIRTLSDRSYNLLVRRWLSRLDPRDDRRLGTRGPRRARVHLRPRGDSSALRLRDGGRQFAPDLHRADARGGIRPRFVSRRARFHATRPFGPWRRRRQRRLVRVQSALGGGDRFDRRIGHQRGVRRGRLERPARAGSLLPRGWTRIARPRVGGLPRPYRLRREGRRTRKVSGRSRGRDQAVFSVGGGRHCRGNDRARMGGGLRWGLQGRRRGGGFLDRGSRD